MINKIIMLLLFAIRTAAALAQDSVTFKGNIIGENKGYNKLLVHFNNGLPEDSIVIGKDGRFQYKYPYSPNLSVTIYMDYDIKVRQRVFPFVIITDGGGKLVVKNIDITKTMHSGKLSGSRSAVDFLKLQRQYMTYSNKPKDSVTKVMSDLVAKFVADHSESYASVAAIRNYSINLDNTRVESIYEMLSPQQRESKDGKAIAVHINGLKRSAIGSKIDDFTLPAPDGKGISFSSLKGKYVLIDFWASWCGPCKASFPHLKELYAKYKSDKFEILGISIDQSKQAWLGELPKQDLPWLQVLDNQNISRKVFAIVGVPTTYLLDPEGVILLKEIGFQEKGGIHRKLQELFGQ